MTQQKETNAPIKNLTESFEPVLQATGVWISEMEKFQKLAMENMTKAVDDGTRLVKEGMVTLNSVNTTVRQQWQNQMERAGELVKSFLP